MAEFANGSPEILRAASKVVIWGEADAKSSNPFSGAPERSQIATREAGYRFRIIDSDRDFYQVEMRSGKAGYVRRDDLVTEQGYKSKDSYPPGIRMVRSLTKTVVPIFVVETSHSDGILVYKQANQESRQLFVLAPLEAVVILESLHWYYRVLLPGPTEGFVLRNEGERRYWASQAQENYGFYGIRKDRGRTVGVRFAPEMLSETMLELDTQYRLPVVEEWDGWFRVQSPDGCLGFVPEGLGNRTIGAETFIDKPKEGSKLLGLAAIVGALAIAGAGNVLSEGE